MCGLKSMRTVLVTGGAGFIGSNFVRLTLTQSEIQIINLDKLTYAGNLESLASVMNDPNHVFLHTWEYRGSRFG